MSNSEIFRVPKDFSSRPGTVDFGRDYEIRMSALLGMRCIRNKEINCMWLATNVNECGAFDDLVLHVETRKKKKITYLIQLKHKMEPDDIGAGEFKKKNGNFSMEKYYETVTQIKSAIDIHSVTDTEVIEHLRENEDNLVFVLYTNRGTTKNNFLNKINRGSNTDSSWMLYKMVDTSGNVSTIDYGQLGLKYKNNHNHLMEKFFLFTKQIHVSKLDGIIEEEVNGFIKNIVLSKLSARELVQQYLQFITDWYKGKLGGFYPLTKTHIYKVLLANIVSPYMELNEICHKQNEYCYDLWKNITEDKWMTIVEADDFVVDFLQIFIYKAIRDYCENGENKNVWKRHPELLCKDMLRVINRSKEVKFLEAYELLRKTAKLPFLLNVDCPKEHNALNKLLQLFPNIFKIIIFLKFPVNIGITNKVPFTSLTCLNEQFVSKILNYPVKLQGRQSVKLLQYLDRDSLHYISSKDIIYILNNKFSIGDAFPPLPNIFIERTLETVWLKPEVLKEVSSEVFIINCDPESNLKVFFTRYKLNINYLQVLKWEDDVEYVDSRIIEISDESKIEEVEKRLSLKGKQFHYLILHSGHYLQWIKSSGTVKNIINFRKLSNMSNFESNITNFLFANCLNKVVLISASPGMGKSFLVDYIALNIPTGMWVIKINLHEHTDYFKTESFANLNVSDHLEYFFRNSPNLHNNSLARFIFQKYLDIKKIVLLFDGFDEVSISQQDKVLKMIKAICDSNYFVYLTSRPNLKSYLEESLGTFGISINPFTKANQITFLTKYFFNILQLGDLECINNFVSKLLDLSKRNLNDQDREFTGIPLQTQLLAEVFADDCKYFIETNQFRNVYFDLLYLYEHFINEKIKIVCKKFGNSSEDTFHNYRVLRSFYALQVLFSKEDLGDFNIEEKLKQIIQFFPNTLQEIQKDGIVIAENKTKIVFVHRVFAEYLAAEWLANNIYSENQDIVKKLIIQLFDPHFITVRNIFDRILAKDCPLHLAIINRQVDRFRELLTSNSIILSDTDKGERTYLHLIASWGVYHPSSLKNASETRALIELVAKDPMTKILKLTPNEKLTSSKDRILNCTQIDYAMLSNSLNVAEAICIRLEDVDEAITRYDAKTDYVFYFQDFAYRSLNSIFARYSITEELQYLEKKLVGKDNQSQLNLEIMKGNIQQASMLLCLTVDINKPDCYGFTPLHIASMFPDALLTQLLLVNNADPNIKDYTGKTALHWATIKGNIDVMMILLDNHADVNAIDCNCMTALHYAIVINTGNRSEIVSLLLKNNADVMTQDIVKKTPLHYALHYNQKDILKLLLNIDGNINDSYLLRLLSSKDRNGGTIIHWATDKGLTDIVALLLSYGVDIDIKDEDDKTALHWAVEKGHTEIINLLLSHGANINAKDIGDRTPLFLAVENGNADVIELLLDREANADESAGLGRTPLLQAVFMGNKSIVDILLARKVNVLQRDNEDMNVLHFSAWRGDISLIHLFLPEKQFLEESNTYGRTPLASAAQNGHTEAVVLLASKGAYIDVEDKQNRTALHWAVYNNHLRTVEVLLSLGANVEAEDEIGRTPLLIAAIHGYKDIVELLLAKGANIEARSKEGLTALSWASSYNRCEIVNSLTTRWFAQINTKDVKGFTPLLHAARYGHIDVITTLIFKNANIELQNADGINALHMAAHFEFHDMVDLLIANEAKIETKDGTGKTALIHSAHNGHLSILNLLFGKGANVEAKDNLSMTALAWAAHNGHVMVVNMLVGLKANIEAKNEYGATPIICAVVNKQPMIVNFLILKGADVKAVDDRGFGAVQWAAHNGSTEILTFFLSKGVYFDEKDCHGRTLLMHTACNNHVNIAKLLLSKGAKVNEQDNLGSTPMHFAARNGHTDTIDLLLSSGADMEIKNSKGRTVVLDSAFCNQQSVVELLIEKGAALEETDNLKCTVLHYAALHGNADMVELILNRKNDLIQMKDELGKTPLLHAAIGGQKTVLIMILSKGAGIESMDNEHMTALTWAATKGNLELIDTLIDLKANLEVKNKEGCTPLVCAARAGHYEIVDLLLSRGADINAVDNRGFSLAQWAACNGYANIIDLLLSKGISVDIKDVDGRSLLMHGAFNGKTEVIKLLLSRNLAVDAQDNLGWTAMHFAAAKGQLEAIDLLMAKGADTEIKDQDGRTVLLCALNYDQGLVAESLIEKGVNVEVTDKWGWTILHSASSKGCIGVVRKLLKIKKTLMELKSTSGVTPLMAASATGHTAVVRILLSESANTEVTDHKGRTPLHWAELNDHQEVVNILKNIQKDKEC